ncbi:unnamed protein product [Clavelina lepadiformis]|uniref:Uncharacterized protein n=1 Tax=Clavelina lepadiformis TaxID=159417 RepID=A0ABP0G530_CLALP
MRRVILLLSLACYVIMTYSQEFRQVPTTVCDNDVINSTMPKGDKGDAGRSGKSGLPGAKGEPGGVGEKGMQGESCALGSVVTDILTRLAKVEVFLSISSCATSSSNGPRRLTSGVEVYCEDGWTVSENISTFIREVPQTVER